MSAQTCCNFGPHNTFRWTNSMRKTEQPPHIQAFPFRVHAALAAAGDGGGQALQPKSPDFLIEKVPPDTSINVEHVKSCRSQPWPWPIPTRHSLVGGFHVADKLQEHKGCHGLRSKRPKSLYQIKHKNDMSHFNKIAMDNFFLHRKGADLLVFYQNKKIMFAFLTIWQLTSKSSMNWDCRRVKASRKTTKQVQESLEWDNNVEMWEDGRLAHPCVSNIEKLSSLSQCKCIYM